MSQLIEEAKEAVTSHNRVTSDSPDPHSGNHSRVNSDKNHNQRHTPTTTRSQQNTSENTSIPHSQDDMTHGTIDQGDPEMYSQDEQDIIPGTDHHALHGGRSGKQDTLF